MKISESTSYPHPVLAPWSADISGASFEVALTYREDEKTNQLSIHSSVTLDQSDIATLIQKGSAAFGYFVKCQETGFRRLQRIGFPTGQHDFAPGALLGRVQLRPIIWSVTPLSSYKPGGAHSEFSAPSDIATGQILALSEETYIEVTRPPLPAIESIFEITSSEDVVDGRFEVETGADRITITMGKNTYHLVQELRQTDEATRSVIMNSLYAPVVMQVLEQLGEQGYGVFESYRWMQPFRARCELTHVNIENLDLLNDAQKLLAGPFASLRQLIKER